MNGKTAKKGFSLIELMIVIVIVALLVALAVPSYTRYVRKANRTEAQQLMMQYANNQEIWRANAATYAAEDDALGVPGHTKFNFFVRVSASNPPVIGDCGNTNPDASNFVIVACATGDQLNDVEGIDPCGYLSLDQANNKLPAICW